MKTAKFLGKNGHDHELKEALELLEVGKDYEVSGGYIADWNSALTLAEFPGKFFNTVMFDFSDEVWHSLENHARYSPGYIDDF